MKTSKRVDIVLEVEGLPIGALQAVFANIHKLLDYPDVADLPTADYSVTYEGLSLAEMRVLSSWLEDSFLAHRIRILAKR